MKINYIGESFGIEGLTNGQIYDAIEENWMYRVFDDSGEDFKICHLAFGFLISNPKKS